MWKLTSKEDGTYEHSSVCFCLQTFRSWLPAWSSHSGSCCPGNHFCLRRQSSLGYSLLEWSPRLHAGFRGQRTILYRKRSDLRNRWLDFRFRVRLSSRTTGCGFKGVTANSENSATGYPSPSYFYFKMGLYRDVMAKPMTIYIDEYRKRQLRGDDL